VGSCWPNSRRATTVTSSGACAVMAIPPSAGRSLAEFSCAASSGAGRAAEHLREGVDDPCGAEVLAHGEGGAGLQPFDLQPAILYGGQEDDRGLPQRGLGPQPPTDLVPVHAGHHHIQKDEIRPRGLSGLDPRGAVGRNDRPVTVLFQDIATQGEEESVIVDVENGLPRSRSLFLYVHRPSSFHESG